MNDLAAMREEYNDGGLDESVAGDDPQDLFSRWFDDWLATEPFDANVMTLSTVDSEGWPSARAVLLKGFDDRGLIFYTNYLSDKARHLDDTGRAALTFLWEPLLRQVRVAGRVSRVSAEESDSYFASRPRGSQIGAWASEQSKVITGRSVLEEAVAKTEQSFPNEVPRPPHWGGLILEPNVVEFWHGRISRLHDRIRFRRESGSDRWIRERLSP